MSNGTPTEEKELQDPSAEFNVTERPANTNHYRIRSIIKNGNNYRTAFIIQ